MEIQDVKQRFGIIGNSSGLNYALSIAMRVAPTNLTVLITGESGVGKEVFSKVIHNLSARKHNPFIAVNCGAIPEGTIDSELFGHEKGAFTGATDSRKGYFEFVEDGTIFLDEIGEMPMSTQARLLRVLESGEFIRVGSSKVQKTDVRIIAATNVDLVELVKRGKFREDLYYRLSTVPIKVPPLRERREDIYLLFRKFAVDFAESNRSTPIQLDEDARQLLENYAWPGNVRELKNVAEQISALSTNRTISAEELKDFVPEITQTNLPALMTPGVGSGNGSGKENMDYSERELMYKVIFDMKNDINDMKRFIFQFARGQDEDMSEFPELNREFNEYKESNPHRDVSSRRPEQPRQQHREDRPIVIDDPSKYDDDNVDESLNLADMERELIQRALKKHKNKRKDAALDLGISERTLYRKIKEYNIST